MDKKFSFQVRYVVLCYGGFGYYPVGLFFSYVHAKEYLAKLTENSDNRYRIARVLDYRTPLLGGVLNLVTD